jgi:hypothetical protein
LDVYGPLNKRLADMLNQSDSIDGDGTLSPVILSLSPEAKRAWVECHDAIQGQLARGSTPASSTRSLTEKQGSAVQLQMRWHRQLKIN